MKKFYVIILCLTIVKLNAQNIEWGKIQNSKTSVYRPHIFGDDKNSIYLISYERDNIAIERFDKTNWNKIYSKQISANSNEYSDDGNNNKFDRQLQGTTFLSNQFIVFTSGYDDDTRLVKLYASVYHAETGEKIKENNEIFKVQVDSENKQGGFGFLSSKNKKFMLIHHNAYHKKQKIYESHNLIIDGSLDVIIDKKETVNSEENSYTINNYLVDNEGSFYYLKRFNSAESYLVSHDVNKNYEKWEEKIKLDDLKVNYSLSNITLDINEKNDVLISGTCDYLSEKALKYPGTVPGELRGCFFMKVDNYSKEFVVNKISYFSTDYLDGFRTEKEIKREEKAYIPDNYTFTKILSKKDGGCIFMTEYFSVTSMKNGSLYNFGDILIINLSAGGNIIWEQRIRKLQGATVYLLNSINSVMTKIRYFSYSACYNENRLVVLYNDNPKNIGKPIAEDLDYCKIHDGIPVMATIDLLTGEMKNEIMNDLKTSKIHLMPAESYQAVQNSDAVLYAQDKQEFKFGILKFN